MTAIELGAATALAGYVSGFAVGLLVVVALNRRTFKKFADRLQEHYEEEINSIRKAAGKPPISLRLGMAKPPQTSKEFVDYLRKPYHPVQPTNPDAP